MKGYPATYWKKMKILKEMHQSWAVAYLHQIEKSTKNAPEGAASTQHTNVIDTLRTFLHMCTETEDNYEIKKKPMQILKQCEIWMSAVATVISVNIAWDLHVTDPKERIPYGCVHCTNCFCGKKFQKIENSISLSHAKRTIASNCKFHIVHYNQITGERPASMQKIFYLVFFGDEGRNYCTKCKQMMAQPRTPEKKRIHSETWGDMRQQTHEDTPPARKKQCDRSIEDAEATVRYIANVPRSQKDHSGTVAFLVNKEKAARELFYCFAKVKRVYITPEKWIYTVSLSGKGKTEGGELCQISTADILTFEQKNKCFITICGSRYIVRSTSETQMPIFQCEYFGKNYTVSAVNILMSDSIGFCFNPLQLQQTETCETPELREFAKAVKLLDTLYYVVEYGRYDHQVIDCFASACEKNKTFYDTTVTRMIAFYES